MERHCRCVVVIIVTMIEHRSAARGADSRLAVPGKVYIVECLNALLGYVARLAQVE